MKNLFVIILLLFPFICFSQPKQLITVCGHVINHDRQPLPGANVVGYTTNNGTTTDIHGNFCITLTGQESILKISFLGYSTTKRKFREDELSKSFNDTLHIEVVLYPKTEELNVFEINAQSVQLAYSRPAVVILDYDFTDSGMLLLIFFDGKYNIRHVDNNDSTLHEIALYNKPEEIARDCFNNLQILCKDSVYQVYFEDTKIKLMEGVNNEKFHRIMDPCVLATEENVYFREYGSHNQSLVYFLIEKDSEIKRLVRHMSDIENMAATEDFYHELSYLSGNSKGTVGEQTNDNKSYFFTDSVLDPQRKKVPYFYRATAPKSRYELAKEVQENEWYYQKILSRPIYVPMLPIRDSIYIFDHMNDTLWVYSKNGVFQRQTSISYHDMKGWSREIIVDYSGKDCYAIFNMGYTSLLQVDLNSGIVIYEFRLDENIFPREVKVRNGYAYYLYREKVDFSFTNLYKQPLR